MRGDARDVPEVSRPLELVAERAARRERSPYAVIDIGSNSVRLVVYEELGRAPLPRFNEKSLCRLVVRRIEIVEVSS
jgi:exopolyphosphatase/guanosine-5'-triphosphate,3'-diphosphate pyrophosphatase